jgi:hypothetical protein
MPLFLCTVHLLLYISFLKGYRPLLAPERFPGVRGSEFSNFTKKLSALFEIAKRPRKFIPHSNRVQMFCGQALDLKFISTRRSGNGRFTNAPASLLQKNPPTTLPPRLIPPNPNSPLTSRPARPSLLLLAATLSSHVVAPPRILPVVTPPRTPSVLASMGARRRIRPLCTAPPPASNPPRCRDSPLSIDAASQHVLPL